MPGPSWVAYIGTDGNGYGARTGAMNDDEKYFVENHARAETLVETSDPAADYSYDDYALAELDNQFYVFNTSGCSCPSPSETWELVAKGNVLAIVDWVDCVTGYQSSAFLEFKRALEAHGFTFDTKAPSPTEQRDW